MQGYFKERGYKFTNGYTLKVRPSEIENISIATLYDPAENVVLNTQTKPITNRMGIVRHMESICKTALNICAENITYSLTDVIIDEENMNLDAVVTPHHQQSYANICIRLFRYSPQTDYSNCLYTKETRASFMAYNEIKAAIQKTIEEYNYEIKRDKEIKLEYERITLDKRIIYFNNGKIRVEVSNRNSFKSTYIDENILGYDTTNNNVLFKIKDYSINMYERNEILKKVVAICSGCRIDIQRMDGEESEYKQNTWGEFRVVPLKGGIKIYTPSVFNIQKNVNLNYDDYERIIYCIKELVDKINKDPMKYKIKETSIKKVLFNILKK
ncbi:MAG: hypothetical protein K1W35_04180 [Lachnospiraceae bacterium]